MDFNLNTISHRTYGLDLIKHNRSVVSRVVNTTFFETGLKHRHQRVPFVGLFVPFAATCYRQVRSNGS